MKRRILKPFLTLLLALALLLVLCACTKSEARLEAEAEAAAEAAAKALEESTDYADPENWYKCGSEGTNPVDTVFLYPTILSDSQTTSGICDIDNRLIANVPTVYENTGSVFEESTNVYVPYYRAYCMEKEFEISAEGIPAMVETLGTSAGAKDVFDALDYYFANYNNGKPFILAGHGQGSCFLRIVLEDYMAQHPEYLDRMVACYAMGFGFPQSYFDENPNLKPAAGETDTGVVVTWNTEGPAATTENLLVSEPNCACINPLNWVTDDTYADASLCKGSRQNGELVAEGTDAQIDLTRHTLIATGTDAYPADVTIFGDRCLMGFDYSLFYKNIQDNVEARIEAFLTAE